MEYILQGKSLTRTREPSLRSSSGRGDGLKEGRLAIKLLLGGSSSCRANTSPRPMAETLVHGRKRQRVANRLGDQAEVQPVGRDAPTTPVATDPLVSQLSVPTQSSVDRLPIIETERALSSTPPTSGYNHSFTLGERPLPTTLFILTWRKGEGGWVVNNLRKALLLLEDVHFWEKITNEDIVLNLKWQSIVVSLSSTTF